MNTKPISDKTLIAALLAVFLAIVVSLISLLFLSSLAVEAAFMESCEQVNGKTARNGNRWECLK